MSQSQVPHEWVPPIWHPDFGDPRQELDHLKEFALLLLSIMPNASVTLEVLEPGVMELQVAVMNGPRGEVHSLRPSEKCSDRRFAIFFAPGTTMEEEVYAESVQGAVVEFTKRIKE